MKNAQFDLEIPNTLSLPRLPQTLGIWVIFVFSLVFSTASALYCLVLFPNVV